MEFLEKINLNYLMIIIGGFFLLISIILLIKLKNNDEEDKLIDNKLNANNFEDKKISALNAKKIHIISQSIEELHDELLKFKKDNKRLENKLNSFMLKHEKTLKEFSKEKEELNKINNNKQYGDFLSKNKDIIDLYKQGYSSKEIAKQLNKSYREIDMILNIANK